MCWQVEYRQYRTGVAAPTRAPPWLHALVTKEQHRSGLTSHASYTLSNLRNQTVYDVRVKAVNGIPS